MDNHLHKLYQFVFQNEFGSDVILEDGSGKLDRDALRRIILADDNKRRSLDRITHPYIVWQMAWEVVSLAAAGNNFAVLDIPLLFESGGKTNFFRQLSNENYLKKSS